MAEHTFPTFTIKRSAWHVVPGVPGVVNGPHAMISDDPAGLLAVAAAFGDDAADIARNAARICNAVNTYEATRKGGHMNRWQELNRLGLSEGWAVFHNDERGLEIERIDDHDPQLPDDADAIRLARAAGVNCDGEGVLTPDEAKAFCVGSRAPFE